MTITLNFNSLNYKVLSPTTLPLWALLLCAWLLPAPGRAAPVFDIQAFPAGMAAPDPAAVLNGSLDSQFEPFSATRQARNASPQWLKLRVLQDFKPQAMATLNIHQARRMQTAPYVATDGGVATPLRRATQLPGFMATHDVVYALPAGLSAGQSLYVRVQGAAGGWNDLHFNTATLDTTLERGEQRARMIALCFGALMAMAAAGLLIWVVLSDRLLVLYATLFSLQALYVAYLSGQGFDWPLLSLAAPLEDYTWNVSAALSGAAACLFVREIVDMKRYSPRVYLLFGWLAVTFVVLAAANLLELVGLGTAVAAAGNLIFTGTALLTLAVSWLAWRRNNRAAGWFLIAWGLLEAFTIATAIRLLVTEPDGAEGLLYYGLPLSMVAAAVFIALGVADSLRQQRIALSEAERRAQTDALTGVLNRRSLIEQLETACYRAQTRGLPIGLLFIDLDHFKEINDSYGHPAGDACLRAIIDPILAELRPADVIGRYGGEEFVVILNSADAAAAEPIAERIRKRVSEVRVLGFDQPITLTCSIGIATSDTLDVWGEHLIAHADAAVYAAKRSGRNRIQIAASMAA